MDLGLFAGVLWRSRFLVLTGFILACAAGVFAMARVEVVDGSPRLAYRNPALYQSTVQMLVTQPGFPEGRSVFNTTPTTLPSGQVEQPTFADPTRFSALAVIYSQLIMGNVERVSVFGTPKPPKYETILASPMAAPGGGAGYLPIIDITGVAPSPTRAAALADRAATSFSSFLVHRQARTGVDGSDRVILERVAGPLKPTIYLPRKKLRAIFAFALIAMLTAVFAFIRENARKSKAAAAKTMPAVELPLNGQAERPDPSSKPSTALAHDP